MLGADEPIRKPCHVCAWWRPVRRQSIGVGRGFFVATLVVINTKVGHNLSVFVLKTYYWAVVISATIQLHEFADVGVVSRNMHNDFNDLLCSKCAFILECRQIDRSILMLLIFRLYDNNYNQLFFRIHNYIP